MPEFKRFKKEFQNQFKTMGTNLFLADIDKQEMWETYLNAFPEGTNEIYKVNTEYDCNCCKSFIRQYGSIVSIKDNKLVSIWDVPVVNSYFDIVSKKMSKLVKSSAIKSVFLTDSTKAGNDITRSIKEDNTVEVYEHFYLNIPKTLVIKGDRIDTEKGNNRANKEVFKRSMEELSLYAGETIIDLIVQGSLYRGEEHKKNVQAFITYKKQYDKVPDKYKDNWCWNNSKDNPISRIRNAAIGTLLIDISDGVDLDIAVTKFEKVMAPTNYKRPKAIITKRMIEDAENKIKELGIESSLERKYAVLEDVSINNVLFVNRDVKDKLDNNSLFDTLKSDVTVSNKSFSKIEEIGIEDFVNNILPKTTDMEVLMESDHIGNLMTLVAPIDKESPRILQWDNNFSWSYNGDVTDSMKQNVKNAGGNVDGVLRFSIQWNDNSDNENDLDAHCIEPSGNRIYFGSKNNNITTGNLDVDIMTPSGNVAVENITWLDKQKMSRGVYKFSVHNYSHRGGKSGFSAEIEYEGQIYKYEYDKPLKQGETIDVASIKFDGDNINFISSLDNTKSSKEVWGLKTNQFSKVSLFMNSPNYWDMKTGKGNKHYFFFLDSCENESSPRGLYNEFLRSELTQHRRVFEALSNKMKVEDSDTQLSGLGFSSTIRSSLVVKLKGNFNRTIKIKF